jgi:tetratricopeptide (TPR) repeat protein
MQKLVQQISAQLSAFVAQRDNVALVVISPATDSLPILTMLEGVEAESASDFFWTFNDAFADAFSYASAVVAGFSARHDAVRLAMAKEGMRPWPLIPERVLSEKTPPALRLRELAAFSRELLPIPNGGVNVWTYYPLEVADPNAFARLMREVVQHEFPNPWFHHLRFIIREEPGDPFLRAQLSGMPRIQWYQPDLSAEAVQRSLEEESADESLPLEQRMNTLLVLAGNDFALHRYPDALAKYELLFRYHAPLNNYSLAAVALNGIGETYEKMGDLDSANASYEAALVPASHGENPPIPVFLNVVFNLANLRFNQQQWADGEAYYDLGQQLATIARNGQAKVDALDLRGQCQQRQGKLQEAQKSWHDGAVIAAQLEDVSLCRKMVARLSQHYAETGQWAKEREWRDYLAGLGGAKGV